VWVQEACTASVDILQLLHVIKYMRTTYTLNQDHCNSNCQGLWCESAHKAYTIYFVSTAGPVQMPSCTHVARGSWTYCMQTQ